MLKQGTILTLVKYFIVFVSLCFLTTLLVQTIRNQLTEEFFVFGIIFFVLGYALADLMTGTVHWFCDSFFSENTPLIGPLIIASFREHHTHPQLFTQDKFIEQDTTSFFLLLVPLVLAVGSKSSNIYDLSNYLWHCTLIGLSIGAFGTNLFHKWAHQKNPPRFAKKLQKIGLILTPELHKKHHRSYSESFCVTSGWLNPLLDYINFFPKLESFIRFFSHDSRT